MEPYHLTNNRGAFLCGANYGAYIPAQLLTTSGGAHGPVCSDCLSDLGDGLIVNRALAEADAARNMSEGEWCLTCDGDGYTLTAAGKEKRCPDCHGEGRVGL